MSGCKSAVRQVFDNVVHCDEEVYRCGLCRTCFDRTVTSLREDLRSAQATVDWATEQLRIMGVL